MSTATQNELLATVLAIDVQQCRHCQTPVPKQRSGDFCCDGCEAVYSFLQEAGQSEFYRVPSDVPLKPVDSSLKDRDFQSLDLLENVSSISVDGKRIDFYVEDLSCAACVWILDRLETLSTDVAWSRVNLNRSLVTVARSDGAAFSNIAKLIHRLGFKAEPVAAQSQFEALERRASRRSLIRTGILGALTGNIMLLSVSLYGGAQGDLASLFRWLMLALVLPIVTWGAWPLYENSLRSIQSKRISLDLPISLAVLSGFAAGVIGLATGQDLLYFDSIAMLVFLLQASRAALDVLKRKFATVDTVPNWLLQTVKNPANQTQIFPDQISKGTLFEITNGQRLPVDARTQSLSSIWDVSVLTGESRSHRATHGESLAAGSLLLSDSCQLIALGSVRDSRVANLLHDWRNGQRDRKTLTEISDQVGRYFTYAVIALAATLIVIEVLTGFSHGPNGWIRALTLLLAACPCVFGIAIPLAENLSINRLAETGLMIRETSFLEKLNRIKTIYFDKTGTLTTGRMAITSIRTFENLTEADALSIAAGIELHQSHPIARAICAHAKVNGISAKDFNSETVPYLFQDRQIGVQAQLGNLTYRLESEIENRESDHKNVIHLTVANGPGSNLRHRRTLATISLTDELRPGASDTIKSLRGQFAVEVLSGDQEGPVAALLNKLNLKPGVGKSGLTPAAKAKVVSNNGASLMVGDGVNDAEALKRSFASIAVKGDLSSCLDAADAVLLVDSLAPIKDAFSIAAHLRRTLYTTLALSSSINLIAAALAISGKITPLIAAVLMPTSGLIVTLTTWFMLRSPRQRQGTRT